MILQITLSSITFKKLNDDPLELPDFKDQLDSPCNFKIYFFGGEIVFFNISYSILKLTLVATMKCGGWKKVLLAVFRELEDDAKIRKPCSTKARIFNSFGNE